MMVGRRKRDNTAKKVAIGGIIAAVIGYLAGLLTAPKSGKETREDIKEGASKGLAQAEKELKNLHTELDKVIGQAKVNSTGLRGKAKDELNDLVDKAKDSKEKAREMLSAVHEGEAADEDLAKAIKQANNALRNLKKYLKK